MISAGVKLAFAGPDGKSMTLSLVDVFALRSLPYLSWAR